MSFEKQGSPRIYEALWEKAKSKVYKEIDEYELSTGYAIDKYWYHDLALHTQVVIKGSELCYEHGRVLYSTLRRFLEDRDSVHIVETGTARGFSALCMAKAIKDSGKTGTIVTHDILPHDTKMYWNCIDDHDGQKSRAELLAPWDTSMIQFVTGNTKTTLQTQKCDFAFLDGAHTYEDVKAEYAKLIGPKVVVFDDYTPSQFPGICRAVDEIKLHKIYLRSNRGYVIGHEKCYEDQRRSEKV